MGRRSHKHRKLIRGTLGPMKSQTFELDDLLEILDAEQEETDAFLGRIQEEQHSGRGAGRFLSETGGRIHKARGSE